MAAGSTPSPRRRLARPASDAGLARAYVGAAVGIGLLAAALAKVAGDSVSPLLLLLVPLEVAAGTALLLGRAPSWALAWAAADLGVSAAVLGDVGAAALVPAALALMSAALVASRRRGRIGPSVLVRWCLSALRAPAGRTDTRDGDAPRSPVPRP